MHSTRLKITFLLVSNPMSSSDTFTIQYDKSVSSSDSRTVKPWHSLKDKEDSEGITSRGCRSTALPTVLADFKGISLLDCTALLLLLLLESWADTAAVGGVCPLGTVNNSHIESFDSSADSALLDVGVNKPILLLLAAAAAAADVLTVFSRSVARITPTVGQFIEG
jgi:hypothetical protein